MLYKVRILMKNNGFSAELQRGVVIECQLDGYHTADAAAIAINKKVDEYNAKHHLAIPHIKRGDVFVSYQTDEHDEHNVQLPIKEIKPLPTAQAPQPRRSSAERRKMEHIEKQAEKQAKLTKPETKQAVTSKPKTAKRKPFTPYGLNGYFVDKQGNIRLMLDRRANAHTIVLMPEMFSSLAEMVKKTQAQQEQHNG